MAASTGSWRPRDSKPTANSSSGCWASVSMARKSLSEEAAAADAPGWRATGGRRSRAARSGSTMSNPIMPTRWSQPVPAAQIETTARTRTAAPEPTAAESAAPAVEIRPIHRGGAAPVIVAGTLDTKGAELRFIRDQIAAAGVRVLSGRSFDFRRTLAGRRTAAPRRGLLPRRAECRFHRRPGRGDHRDGGSVRSLDQRQEPIGGLISAGGSGGKFVGRAGDARSADRRAQSSYLVRRLRQRRPLCRARRTS